MKWNSRHRMPFGFTLLELMVVVAIVAVLLSLGAWQAHFEGAVLDSLSVFLSRRVIAGLQAD